MSGYVLIVPAQHDPKGRWDVPEQRSACCSACGQHFIDAAGMGRLEVAAAIVHPCTLSYPDVCLDPKPVTT